MERFAHQQQVVDDDPKRTGLFLGTGSSKTRIALDLAEGSTLVIMPKTQLEDRNWWRENERWACGVDLTTMTFDIFKRDSEELERFDTVIVDEGHGMLGVTPNTRQKNRQPIPKASQRYDALEAYLERCPPKRFYIVTATIIKTPFTVWAAGKLLGKRRGDMKDFYDFRYEFYTKLPMPGREVWAPKTDSTTKSKLAALVREYGYTGRLEDFFDVPDQTFKTEYVATTEAQEKRIKQLTHEYPEPIVRVGKRHQVENGCLSADEFSIAEEFPNEKMNRIVELALEFPRLVIFAKYRKQIEMLEERLLKEGYKVLTMTGDTKERGTVIKEVNLSENCIFIVQAQISAGWELPGPTKDHPEYFNYPVMVFASRTYSFVDYDQALGRIQRASNVKKNLYINLVVKGGVDEGVNRALENKSDFNERIYSKV